jgi:hypothetical protein
MAAWRLMVSSRGDLAVEMGGLCHVPEDFCSGSSMHASDGYLAASRAAAPAYMGRGHGGAAQVPISSVAEGTQDVDSGRREMNVCGTVVCGGRSCAV